MNLDYDQMSTRQKVASLLIALGPGTASEILKNIRDEDLLEQITYDHSGRLPSLRPSLSLPA